MSNTQYEGIESRQACYRLFSAAFCLPEEDQFITSEDLRVYSDVLVEMGSSATDSLLDMASELEQADLDELKVEYSRLFVGPFSLPFPPYGSVYLDKGRLLMGDSTIDAVRRYREAGVEMDRDQQDVPDHIAVELEFMSYLLHLESQAITHQDAAGVREARERQEAFLEKHLCAWVPRFADGVVSDTTSPFYRSLVEGVSQFLTEDAERVRVARDGE